MNTLVKMTLFGFRMCMDDVNQKGAFFTLCIIFDSFGIAEPIIVPSI